MHELNFVSHKTVYRAPDSKNLVNERIPLKPEITTLYLFLRSENRLQMFS